MVLKLNVLKSNELFKFSIGPKAGFLGGDFFNGENRIEHIFNFEVTGMMSGIIIRLVTNFFFTG